MADTQSTLPRGEVGILLTPKNHAAQQHAISNHFSAKPLVLRISCDVHFTFDAAKVTKLLAGTMLYALLFMLRAIENEA